jgi:alpha-galactosidase
MCVRLMQGGLVRQRTNASDPTDPATARTYNIVEQVFSRDLAGGEKAVVLFNRAETAETIAVSWTELQLPPRGSYRVRDVWAHGSFGADLGTFTDGYSAVVQPHAAMTLRVSPAAA